MGFGNGQDARSTFIGKIFRSLDKIVAFDIQL